MTSVCSSDTEIIKCKDKLWSHWDMNIWDLVLLTRFIYKFKIQNKHMHWIRLSSSFRQSGACLSSRHKLNSTQNHSTLPEFSKASSVKRKFRLLEENNFFKFYILTEKKLAIFNFSNFFSMLQLRGIYVNSVQISPSREKAQIFWGFRGRINEMDQMIWRTKDIYAENVLIDSYIIWRENKMVI